MVPVGHPVDIAVGSALSPITATVADPAIAGVYVDSAAQRVTVLGKAPGTTVVTISDLRGVHRDVPVRVAYYAGAVADRIELQLTGDPASADFVREQVSRSVREAAQVRPDAQIIVTADDVPARRPLEQDDVASFDVPVLIQGSGELEVDGSTHVDVQNVAVPRISPDSLMVSDYPERLTETGTLFTADLSYAQPSRFLYFHYNPPTTRQVNRAGASFCAPKIFHANLRSFSSLAVAAARRRTRWTSGTPRRSAFSSTSSRIRDGS
jgi:hypothetical protein